MYSFLDIEPFPALLIILTLLVLALEFSGPPAISIESNKSIRVSVPKFLTYKYAEYIVYTKIDWIKKSIEKLSQKTQINRNNISFNKEKAKLFLLKRTYHLAKNKNFNKKSKNEMGKLFAK